MVIPPLRRLIAWSLPFLGLLMLICLLNLKQVQAEGTIYHPDGDQVIFDIALWKGDHVINGNLTIPDNTRLVIENGDLIFNTTTYGQYGLFIQPLGTLEITNGAIQGNNPIRLDIQGEIWAVNSDLEDVIDEGAAHVNGGHFVWESGSLPEGHLNLQDALVELKNYTSATDEPTLWLNNSDVRLLNTTFALSKLRIDDNTSSIEVGYFVELTFHGRIYDVGDGNLTSDPITDGVLSITWNGTTVRDPETDSTGSTGAIDLVTKRFANGTWAFHNEYTFNFSRKSAWWTAWNLTLNASISEQLNLGPIVSINDVSIINEGRRTDSIFVDDSLVFRISITNKANIWMEGDIRANLMWYATRLAWTNTSRIFLEPYATVIVNFYWNASEVGNYALYLLFMNPSEQDPAFQISGQKNVDVRAPVHQEPTFLGLGYEYWLVILPLLALLSAIAVTIIRERSRLGKYRVEEVFLLDSIGRVIGHSTEGEGSLDEDIVGSMLSALQDFVTESFHSSSEASDADGTDGEEVEHKLKRLEHGALMLLIEHGYHCFIVLVISGQDRPEIRKFMLDSLKDIEARFGPVLSNWDGDASKMEGAGEIVDQLARVKTSVRWNLDPRALIAGWKERHSGKRP